MNHLIIKKTEFKSRKKKGNAAILFVSIGLALSMTVLPELTHAKGNGGKGAADESHLTYMEEFGKRLFFANISSPKRQSCSSCHTPSAGGTNGKSHINLTQVAVTGANPHTVGTLKPPTNKYAAFLELKRNKKGEVASKKIIGLQELTSCGSFPTNTCGGAFWDGRATGGDLKDEKGHKIDVCKYLGKGYDKELCYKYQENPVTHQAHASPFINPVEQGLADKTATCNLVESTKWGAELYEHAWGIELNCGKNIDHVFARFAVALGAWQLSEENNNFTSKRDAVMRGEAKFTKQEEEGQSIFYSFRKGRCFFCHQSDDNGPTSLTERYTDDSYHNVGFPRNYEIPGSPEPSIGLKGFEGEQKTSTLRNVDQRPGRNFVKAYTHNGYFKTLEGLVHFYNSGTIGGDTANEFGITRCPTNKVTEKEALAMNCWPEPEFPGSAAVTGGFAAGDLGLSLEEEAALVAYLKTFNDEVIVKEPKPYKSAPKDPKRMKHY